MNKCQSRFVTFTPFINEGERFDGKMKLAKPSGSTRPTTFNGRRFGLLRCEAPFPAQEDSTVGHRLSLLPQ